MLKSDYHYAVEIFREDGTRVEQVPVSVDWEPAREWTWFLGIRRGQMAPGELGRETAVHPIWHSTAAEPYLEGFRVSLGNDGREAVSSEFTSAYFRGVAERASSQLVESGKLKEGERFRYLAAAFPGQESRDGEPKVAFRAEEVACALPLRQTSLDEFGREAAPQGQAEAEEIPVFVPQQVLEEATALTREAGAKETGGVLIGHLHRDSGRAEVFVEVTAQIPARHTQADSTKLTFTPETWTDVRAALELRRRGELMVGWWHSHPVKEWCKECPVERQKACRLSRDFLSAHDHALHRAVFPRAYSIALVANDVAFADPTFSLFGWKQGLLEPRGFHVLGAVAPAKPVETAPVVS